MCRKKWKTPKVNPKLQPWVSRSCTQYQPCMILLLSNMLYKRGTSLGLQISNSYPFWTWFLSIQKSNETSKHIHFPSKILIQTIIQKNLIVVRLHDCRATTTLKISDLVVPSNSVILMNRYLRSRQNLQVINSLSDESLHQQLQ